LAGPVETDFQGRLTFSYDHEPGAFSLQRSCREREREREARRGEERRGEETDFS
jgi:hypothetical protein